MQVINCSKERAAYFLDCLDSDKPIQPSSVEGWTRDDMLALAGACHHSLLSQGPMMHDNVDVTRVSHERREAIMEQFSADVMSALQFYSHLTMFVHNGQYDEEFEPRVKAGISCDEGTVVVRGGEGFKKQ